MESSPNGSQIVRSTGRIEILPVDLLVGERDTVNGIAALASQLEIGLGWHYLLDLAWLCRQLDAAAGMKVLDAGAGTGILQWYLADHGVDVLSVDRNDRMGPPHRIRRRYRVEGSTVGAYSPSSGNSDRDPRSWRTVAGFPRRHAVRLAQVALERFSRKAPGIVTFLDADLADLCSVGEGTIDAVVSVSALEHNDLEAIPAIVTQLHRVLKPGGCLLTTMAASRDHDWYHKPSRGWVLTPDTIRQLFSASDAQVLGFDGYSELLRQLTACRELREGLAAFYFDSGENGMPWGVWKPSYLPVGIALVKSRPGREALWC